MSKIGNKWIGEHAVKEPNIDWGTTSSQVNASQMPVVDTNGFFTVDTVEQALSQIASKLLASWDLVSNKSVSGGSVDIDAAIRAAAKGTPTARTTFVAGTGVVVDAIGDYTGGTALPTNGSNVLEHGHAGYYPIRLSSTKDPIDDASGNEVYAIGFYDSGDNKFYAKFYSDKNDVQTAYTFGSATVIDFFFPEVFNLMSLPAEGFCVNGVSSVADVVAGDITGVTAGAGLTGGGLSGNVTLAVGDGDGLVAGAGVLDVDVTDLVDANYSIIEVGTNNIGVNLKTSGGLDHDGTNGLMVDVSDIFDSEYGITESANVMRINLDSAGGLEFNSASSPGYAIRIKAAGVKDSMIDFGTGVGQVSAVDIPLTDDNNVFDTHNVQAALEQISGVSITAGDGIDASGTIGGKNLSISVDVTDIIDTNAGLKEDTGNKMQINLESAGGMEFNATTHGVQIKADGVKDSMIDWGTAAGQVSAVDMPVVIDGSNTDVQTQLQTLTSSTASVSTIVTYVTLTETDITNKYCVIDAKARGSAGVKSFVQVCPMGGPPQRYMEDFVAMNNDANDKLIIIWGTDASVTGIDSGNLVLPTAGLADILTSGDVLQVVYQ